MKVQLSELNYGALFILMPFSTIIYKVISGPKGREFGISVKDASGAIGRLSGSRYVYKLDPESAYVGDN